MGWVVRSSEKIERGTSGWKKWDRQRISARIISQLPELEIDGNSKSVPIFSTPVSRSTIARGERGFTLIEVLVAAAIMGIAVAGVLGGLSTASRNAARLTQMDRAALLARQKMDEILVEPGIPRKRPLQGMFDPNVAGGTTAGWNAVVLPFEVAPGAAPGQWVLDRVQVEVWWMDGQTRHSFSMEGFRRGILRPGDL